MINYNGKLITQTSILSNQNRGYAYGDALFETIKASFGKLFFFEDHYFRLMASMRIMRMDIPMSFTMEFIEEQILKTLEANQLLKAAARVKFMVNRKGGGLYTPNTNAVEFVISVKLIDNHTYCFNDRFYEVDLFKDFYISPSLLSTLKTNNKAINVIGSIYAKENKLDNCFLLNTNKQVIEALNGNIFLVKDTIIKTPKISDGCLKGVMRTQLLRILKALPAYSIIEESVSPFELQKADEIFITNVITGIQPVSKYRKKTYSNQVSKILLERVNETTENN